jgi:hypothetical protein
MTDTYYVFRISVSARASDWLENPQQAAQSRGESP